MEKWRSVPGWERYYQVSNLGRVKSRPRVIRVLNPWGKLAIRRYRSRVLKTRKTRGGYPLVCFTAPGKKRLTIYVHDLVLLAFKGPKPPGRECCHGNGKRADNRLKNLRYGTRSENALDRHKHGTFNQPRGADHPLAKLTAKEVEWIRSNKGRLPARAMARQFGVSHGRIRAVLNRESYR